MRSSLAYDLLALATLLCFARDATAKLENDQATLRIKFERRQIVDSTKYPPPDITPSASLLPQAWKDALDAAVKAGKIPNIPIATTDAVGNTAYPNGVGMSKDVCSWTTSKCFGPNDLHQAPDGTWTIAFDDGPTPQSPDLYQFLREQNQSATHFYIGSQVYSFMPTAQKAAENGDELAVHTWSHSLQTTKTNEEILGELGWTMQIIYDVTGRIPSLWRPPQGDIDNRVRAIAELVLGLTAVMWSEETNDWCIQQDNSTACPNVTPGKDYASVERVIQNAIKKPKSPGVMLLQHELYTPGINIIKETYPMIKQNGWKTLCVSDAFGREWYSNAKNAKDTPTKQDNILPKHAIGNVSVTAGGSGIAAVKTSSNASTLSSTSANHTNGTSIGSKSGALPTAVAPLKEMMLVSGLIAGALMGALTLAL